MQLSCVVEPRRITRAREVSRSSAGLALFLLLWDSGSLPVTYRNLAHLMTFTGAPLLDSAQGLRSIRIAATNVCNSSHTQQQASAQVMLGIPPSTPPHRSEDLGLTVA